MCGENSAPHQEAGAALVSSFCGALTAAVGLGAAMWFAPVMELPGGPIGAIVGAGVGLVAGALAGYGIGAAAEYISRRD